MLVQQNILFQMDIYSHFFKLTKITPRIKALIYKLCSNYIVMGFVKEPRKKPTLKPIKVFAVRTANDHEYRFHIGQLKEFLELLEKNYVLKTDYKIITHELYEPKEINFKLQDKWKLFDYQVEIDNFVCRDEINDNNTRLIALPTGKGKTTSSLSSASILGKRVAIVVLPKYMQKWGGDVTNVLTAKPKDVMLIRGSEELQGLINSAIDNELNTSFLIISLKTLQNFYKSYIVNNGDVQSEGYNCAPEELFQILGVGTIIIDESHEHIHAVYKTLTFTHVPKVIALTATLLSDVPVMKRIHKAMFPMEIRYDKVRMNQYIKVIAVSYSILDIEKKRVIYTQRGTGVYSHNEFEQSIIRNKSLLASYIKLIDYIVTLVYFQEYKNKDKVAIYAASIHMCTILTDYFKNKYPKFNVKRYVEQDPYENIIQADMTITTILSAGTALDIPNLRAVVSTISIQSATSNIQLLGRLRELKDRDVKFAYIFCEQISKQVDYHRERKVLYEDRVDSIKEFRAPFVLV